MTKISKKVQHDAGKALGNKKSNKTEKELAAEVLRQIKRKKEKGK